MLTRLLLIASLFLMTSCTELCDLFIDPEEGELLSQSTREI